MIVLSIIVGVFLSVSPPIRVYATPDAVGTNTLTLKTLIHITLCSGYCFSATYTNNASANVTAVIYGVVRNDIGQTIYYTTATLHLPPGTNETAFLVWAGLGPPYNVTYCMNVFAVTPSSIVISTTSTICVHYY